MKSFNVITALFIVIFFESCTCAKYPFLDKSKCHFNESLEYPPIYSNINVKINEDPKSKAFGPAEGVTKILPTTNWCGAGTRAANESELGIARRTDACCREHDHCPAVIRTNEFRYGFANDGKYTRLHCICERRFFKCLLNAVQKEKLTASGIMSVYFDRFFKVWHKTYCFDKIIPDVKNRKCLKQAQSKRYSGKCVRYEDDEFENNKRGLTMHDFFDSVQGNKTVEYLGQMFNPNITLSKYQNVTRIMQDAVNRVWYMKIFTSFG